MTYRAFSSFRRLALLTSAFVTLPPLLLPATAALAQTAPAGQDAAGAELPAAPTQPANPGPSITGFRGANFGMTEAEVRRAAQQEFSVPASAIQSGENPIQHTDLLTLSVPNLVPNGGTAAVTYVFGYQSHKLIQISVLWSTQIDPKTTPQMIYQNGATLQQYFATEGFPPGRSTGGIVTASGILLFRATDPTGNAVALILSGTLQKDPKSPDKTALSPNALTLTYAENAEHPDIFQLKPGSF